MSTTPIETPPRFRSELRAALMAAAETAPRPAPDHRNAPVIRTPSRTVRRLAPGMALAVVIAVAVFAFRSGGGVAPQTASAASVLRTSAVALERHAASWALGPGEYFYRRFAVSFRYTGFGHGSTFVVRSIDQLWSARDGAGRTQEHVVGVNGTPEQKRSVFARGYDDRLRPSRKPFLLGLGDFGISLSYAQLRSLPTDPGALGRYVGRVASHIVRTSPLAKAFSPTQLRTAIIFQLTRSLGEVPSSAGVRASIYRLLATTPGIRLLGHTRDVAGRSGVALEASAGLFRFEIVLDPRTGTLLQTSRSLIRRTPLMPGYPAGLVNRSTILRTGVVGSTDSIP